METLTQTRKVEMTNELFIQLGTNLYIRIKAKFVSDPTITCFIVLKSY